MIYLDSSILLEVYLRQSKAEIARHILAEEAPKISSWVLAVEVPVSLRRVLSRPMDAKLLKNALRRFDSDVQGIALYEGLPGVAERVRHDVRLAGCRSLDALHIATALQLMTATGHVVRMATLDARLAAVAQSVGFEVVPS